MNELALFAGAGGGILGGKLLGWRTVCAVEWDAYARDVLVARQNDGCLDPFPIWDDVQTFDGLPWRGAVDVVSGGFPCQDISVAGKGVGIDGKRSGMWKHMARIVREVGPRFVFVENSPALTVRGLGVVLGDLAAMGYDADWGVLGAIHAGAPHKRERIWIVAQSIGAGTGSKSGAVGNEERRTRGEHVPALRQIHGANGSDRTIPTGSRSNDVAYPIEQQRDRWSDGSSWWECEPEEALRHAGRGGREKDGMPEDQPKLGRVADGMAYSLDRLRVIGNGQVPAVAALAWQILNTENNAITHSQEI
jgi:DNA (cytosine-5)-methyltransferase 1